MKYQNLATLAASAALFTLSAFAVDVDPIVIKGSKFFYKTNGTQFFLRGVAYQQEIGPSGSQTSTSPNLVYKDPLTDVEGCKRDIPILRELRTNTIRVYAIDPKGDHRQCMDLLAQAGIYVVADLSQPDQSINRNDATWNDDLYQRYTSVIDALAGYTNVLGFFAGNEVSNAINNTDASAFVKAAVRDMKAYIKARNYRPIGVGYATNDDREIRSNLAKYFSCGKSEESIDFWGYNIYSWCGQSSFLKSGYDKRTEEFKNYPVPVFFAEYGCNEIRPRLFTEVGALYGPQMSNVWSGGIVYMYFEETNRYGLVSLNGKTVNKLPDFTALSSQIARATPTGVNMRSYNPANLVVEACPTVGPTWAAQSSPLPPPANPELCQCMYQSLSCAVNDKFDEKEYGKLFGTVCGMNNQICAGIAHNATSGVYGAYSMCNPREQLSFVLNQYSLSQKKRPDACKFGGAAITRQAAPPSSNCKALMSQAGPNGQGTVSATPRTVPGPKSSKAKSSGTIDATGPLSLNIGMVKIGLSMMCAFIVGASLVVI